MTDSEVEVSLSLLDETVARIRRNRSDDAFAEAKAAAGGLPRDVWNTVSAFANTEGGLIILGLEEMGGLFLPAVGFDPQVIVDALSNGFNGNRGEGTKVVPVPGHQIDRAMVDGSPVVVVSISPLLDGPGPCYVAAQGIRDGSYERWDDQNRHLSPYRIYLLQHRNEYLPLDRAGVPGSTESDLNPDAVDAVIDKLRRTGSRALLGVEGDRGAILKRLQMLEPQGELTLAGLLAAGWYPQQFYPQLFVDVTTHPSREKSSPLSTVRFLDRQECEGAIPTMVDDAVHAVLRNLQTRRVVKGVAGVDVPEVPVEVLREAITNALIHRDYSHFAHGQQVAVDVYPDRIEITNPGGFWGGVTSDNIIDGHSRSRNDALVKLLSKVPLPAGGGAVVENQGSGVPLMLGAMRTHGLPAPVFESRDGIVRVTLYRHGLLTDEVAHWLQEVGAASLSEQEQMALALARESDDGVSVATLRAQLALDSDDARQMLESLAGRGYLLPVWEDFYQTPSEQSRMLSALPTIQQHIIAVLGAEAETALPMRVIAERTGENISSLRTAMRSLVARGLVVATAPPTSRSRSYYLHETLVGG